MDVDYEEQQHVAYQAASQRRQHVEVIPPPPASAAHPVVCRRLAVAAVDARMQHAAVDESVPTSAAVPHGDNACTVVQRLFPAGEGEGDDADAALDSRADAVAAALRPRR